jgi:protoheme IX farnesyltransferase
VRKIVSTRAAVLIALTAAASGVGALWAGVNPTVAGLGLANIVLYAGVYTPMKRLSWLNTWVGAIVGGIPPLMGWAAAAGESATSDGGWRELLFSPPPGWTAALWGGGDETDARTGSSTTNTTPSSAGGWLLAGLLFAWQFPHFMALSWGVREEYKAAGLKMLSWVNPARNARVALRYSIVFFPLCVGLCAAGVTEWSFAVTSLPVNIWLTREAINFWRNWDKPTHAKAARGLFWASVWHLPVIMVLALAQKKGMWGRVWRSIVGEPDEDDDEFEWVDEEE